jgi:phosphoglycerate dehydrogenase-like enzyme
VNVLSYVDLPHTVWGDFLRANPDVRLLQARRPADVEQLEAEPEVIFGNIPAEWARELAARGGLRWMQSVSAGTESYESLTSMGVTLTSARGVHHHAIAQHVLTMMLALTRNVPNQLRAQHDHQWQRRADTIISIDGGRVGIIGYGGIGRELARLLEPFDSSVTGVRERAGAATEENGAVVWSMDRLDELIATSDHVVLCLPMLEKYRRLIDERRIALMRHDAYFHNIARGALVDQRALLRALREGRIAGAALDVFEEEPLSVTSTVWDTPNLIATPHIAGHDRELRERCLHLFLENFALYSLGLPLKNVVISR